MEILLLIPEIKAELHTTFALVDTWFDQPASIRTYLPVDNGWTVDEVLNHIGLTNHYLLILIEKGTAKALANLRSLDLQAEVAQYHFEHGKLAAIGTLHAFPWQRPGHMSHALILGRNQ